MRTERFFMKSRLDERAWIAPKSAFVLALSALALLTPHAALAADNLRVGIVDLKKALESSQAGKEAQKKYEVEVKKAQVKLDDKKGEFEKLQASFSKQKDSLNEKARTEKQEQLLTLEKDLKRSFADSQDQLRRKNAQLVGELVEKLRKVVDEFGKKQGYTVILEKGGQSVLFADSSVDITEDVVERFDEATK